MAEGKLLSQVGVDVFQSRAKVVRLRDGTLMAFLGRADAGDREVCARFSADNGATWGAGQTLFSLSDQPAGITGVTEALVDRDGEVHAFMLRQWQPDERGEGEREGPGAYDKRRIDIWHARTENGRRSWQAPKCIWEGYAGALNSVIQLKSGRIILPFSYATPRTWTDRGEGLDRFTFMGIFNAVAAYSNDDGKSWALSNDMKVCAPNIATHVYGAVEPVALELIDGRVWMLIRTQLGRLYESFSEDGALWSRPAPSRFVSSDSPAGVVRLNDGRIVVCWNNCRRYPYAYGGRQVLHAAISHDEGTTWRGYREVARDPLRNEPPPLGGDFGTAYPFPLVTADNMVLISTGQGKGRWQLLRMDPAYLEQTVAAADLSEGLQEWSIFGTKGVASIPHPERGGARLLRVQKLDEEFPAAAVWNFPMGKKGRLHLRLKVEQGNGGVNIGITDHFSPPFDYEDVLNNVVNVGIAADGGLPGGGTLQLGHWHQLELHWNCEKRQCQLILDGQPAGCLHPQRQTEGLSYVRLRCVTEGVEAGALMIDAVQADVSASW